MKTISWDMDYKNHNDTFVPDAQLLEVNVRDASSDAILATLFCPTQGVDLPSIRMTHFTRDVSAFHGRTVRISIDMIVLRNYLDAAFDNFRVDVRRNDCEDGGWKSVFRVDGSPFNDQGDCVEDANTGR